jgi:hypothetical protein
VNELALSLLHAFYGVAAFGASFVIWRIVSMRRTPRDARRWAIELEQDIFALNQAHLDVALRRAVIADRMSNVPKHFEEPLMEASDLGFVVQRALQVEAMRQGVPYPRSWRREGDPEVPSPPAPFIDSPMSVPPPPPFIPPNAPQLPEHVSAPLPPPPPVPYFGPAFVFDQQGRMVPRRPR